MPVVYSNNILIGIYEIELDITSPKANMKKEYGVAKRYSLPLPEITMCSSKTEVVVKGESAMVYNSFV